VRAALAGDRVRVATWIADSDARLRVARRFQVLRASDAVTLARARTEYVCINLDSGRAVRMPELFARAYVATGA
jgi:acyl-CoA thioester hydrolase